MSKTQSFTEAVLFTAGSLIGERSLTPASRALIATYVTGKLEGDAKTAARAAIRDALDEHARERLDEVGAELPMDPIKVHLEFGNFLFDLWRAGCEKPEAPLRVAALARKEQNLAARLCDREELVLLADELEVIKTVLENDAAWVAARFNAYVEVQVDGKTVKRALTLTTDGVRFYNKTLNAVVKLFEASDEPSPAKQQPEADQASAVEVH